MINASFLYFIVKKLYITKSFLAYKCRERYQINSHNNHKHNNLFNHNNYLLISTFDFLNN